jgi:hypothetical protein
MMENPELAPFNENHMNMLKTEMKQDQLQLNIEELEARIAPSINGCGGYEGHPGNQNSSNGGGNGNPSGSATPENNH